MISFLNILFSALVFIIIFSVLVLIHEFGHFYMAKRAGIKVEEFGFGLPPRLWGKKKGETIYSINWIPFGGFVRMLGEDSGDPKNLKDKRSFAAQSVRARIGVIVAGVVMNFLLAWFLMVVGFSVGMEPLLAPEDILPAIEKGQIVLQPGVKVQSVAEKSRAEELGLKKDDVIYEINQVLISADDLNAGGQYGVIRGSEKFVINIDSTENLGAEYYDFAAFPRVKIHNLANHSDPYKAGLRSGDVIISVNGKQIFNVVEFENAVRGVNTLDYEIYRDGRIKHFIVERQSARQVIVSGILPNTPAVIAGIREGDVILSVNGREMTDSQQVIDFTQEHKDENLAYLIQRDGQRIFYEIKPQDGRIGVLLSELLNFDVDPGVSLYNTDLASSVLEVKEEQYPWYTAMYKAVGETWRLSKLTAKMFIGFVGGLVRTGEVPESVSGPLGIAQMTYVFVQEGIIPVIRFVAILSLSLAVINILPFPALDGGRLLFILIEVVIGRKVPQKWEAYIHGLGYLLILGLILAVTFSDILRIFA